MSELEYTLGPDGVGTWKKPAGGGSQPAAYAAVNGLVKDFPLPDNSPAALIDPTAQAWQSGRSYSMGDLGLLGNGVEAQAHPTTNDGVKFETCYGISGLTGSEEPAWSTDGHSNVVDGELQWAPQAAVYRGAWAAATGYSAGDYVLANGFLWQAEGNGTSGGSAPDWASAPDPFNVGPDNEVVDNDITWQNQGRAAVWTAGASFGFLVSLDHSGYSQDFVIPTAPGDYLFNLQYVRKAFIDGGGAEPDWGAETPGSGHYYTDGAILWKETTDPETCVLTGLAAPESGAAICAVVNAADPAALFAMPVVLEDATTGGFAPAAQSAAGNRFPDAATNVSIAPASKADLAYTRALWQPLS